ncbi:MAG: polysaccharide biosynthesis tyrosine autokinase, partial [Methylococcales bacterium]|nr:polysaccharide biosynthesis tyrosine autokinase [Methylococcales bacterium]
MYESRDKNQQTEDSLQIDNTEISLSNIINTLWLRKRILISVTFFISLLAVLAIFQLIPRYTAATQLLIGINSAKVVDIQEVMSGSLNGDSAVIGEMEVIKSRELARKIINLLHLDQYEEYNPALKKPGFFAEFGPKTWLPESWIEAMGMTEIDARTEEEKEEARLTNLTNTFLSKLTVSQVKRSQVINVAFESEDPALAAKIANEIADNYIVGQLQAKFDATKKATDWLNDQLGDLKLKLESSERAVEEYKKTHALLEVSDGTGLSQQQLSEVNSQLIIARAQRAEAEAKYQQVEAIARSGQDIDSVSEVLNSALISSLRGQEAEVQRNYSEMLVEYGARHPNMIQMQAELADIKGKIGLEVKKIAAGLRHSLDVDRARESSLAGSLKQMESKTTGNSEAEVELHALEREATANKALFETFLGRFKETASTQGIAQADARVISFAEIPLIASFPKKNLMLTVSIMGALFFAVFLVFVLEMLSPGVRSPEQIQALFNMTTLGIVPKLMDIKIPPHEYLLEKPQSALAEAMNTLRISLSLLNPDSETKTIVVTSSVPGEGKSTLCSTLARHSASAGKKVVLVDCDLRRPTISKIFNLEKDTLGLTDYLMNHDLVVDNLLVTDPRTGMKILTRGHSAYINPSDLFASQRMKRLIEHLRQHFDLVILDSAPIMAVPDTRILAGLADKTLFVLNWDATPKKVVASALHILNKDGHNNLAGIVLQKVN